MFIRVSSLSIVRVGRKCSRLSLLFCLTLLIFMLLFILTFISSETRITLGPPVFLRKGWHDVFGSKSESKSNSSFFQPWKWNITLAKHYLFQRVPVERMNELMTWGFNQSVVLEDYLDLTDSNSFIRQPVNPSSFDNGTSGFCSPEVKVLIIVASAPGNLAARMAIRDTWGSKKNLYPKGGRLIFILGTSGNNTLEENVIKEHADFGDILEEDFQDSYHNLTLKSIAMLKWVNITCSKYNDIVSSPQYVLKTDDDIFINFDRLLQVVKELHSSKMIGRLTCGAVPIGDPKSKLYMPKYLYPGKVYPGYLSGTAYLLRGEIVPQLLHNALSTPLIHLEDVYVTALLARQSQIYPEDSPFFTYNRIEPKDECAFRYMVNSHQMTPKDMRFVWKNLYQPLLTPCNLRKAKWLRRVPKLTKRLRNLCLFN